MLALVQGQIFLKSLARWSNSCWGGEGHEEHPISGLLWYQERIWNYSVSQPVSLLVCCLIFALLCFLAPFMPRLTPWIVAVAIILLALGLLTIGSILFTWKLYKERSSLRKKEFGSKGKSQCPQRLCVTAPRKVGFRPVWMTYNRKVLDFKILRLEGIINLLKWQVPNIKKTACAPGRVRISLNCHCISDILSQSRGRILLLRSSPKS